jgi:sulfopropanediol 3-dehydrogenase
LEYLKSAEAPVVADTRSVQKTVSEILSAVEREGVDAVRRYSERFDGWNPPTLRLAPADIASAEERVTPELAAHIDFAREQVGGFARVQKAMFVDVEHEPLPGVTLGHRNIPVDSVGSYVPGGRYPLIASALMTIAVPKVAGVRRVVATAPPRPAGGGIDPAQIYAMASSGADEILSIGGVQALAALAYGIEDTPPVDPVDMIVGAGNAYVAEAKRQLFGTVGIDLMAGPTEVLILGDESSDPRLVAADLLGQAEHGPTSATILVTTSNSLGRQVLREIDRWLETWPTARVAREAWRACGEVIICDSAEEVVVVANRIASEHVEVQTSDPDWFLERLTNYGSLFLGSNATVVYGDKAIGTNHVLPTERAARYTGGLWVGKFIKTVTYQRVSDAANAAVAPTAAAISEAEGLAGHAITALLRMERGVKARHPVTGTGRGA